MIRRFFAGVALAFTVLSASHATAGAANRLKLTILNGYTQQFIQAGAGCGSIPITTPSSVQNGTNGTVGYTLLPQARFSDVTNQLITAATYTPGVMAGHVPSNAEFAAGTVDNITAIGFVLDCGQEFIVSSASANSDTQLTDFHPVINTSGLTAGEHQLRAFAYASTGKTGELQDTGYTSGAKIESSFYFRTGAETNGQLIRYVSASGGGSACTVGSPCATIDAAWGSLQGTTGCSGFGGTCFSNSVIEITTCGSYADGRASSAGANGYSRDIGRGWMTIRGAASLDRSCVIINSRAVAVANISSIKYKHLTFANGGYVATYSSGFYSGGVRCWLDDVAYAGAAIDAAASGITTNRAPYDSQAAGFTYLDTATTLVYTRVGAAGNWSSGLYGSWILNASSCTKGMWFTNVDMANSRLVTDSAKIVKNTTFTAPGDDVVSNSLLVANVSSIDCGGVGGAHADNYQFNNSAPSNVIIDGFHMINSSCPGLYSDGTGSVNGVLIRHSDWHMTSAGLVWALNGTTNNYLSYDNDWHGGSASLHFITGATLTNVFFENEIMQNCMGQRDNTPPYTFYPLPLAAYPSVYVRNVTTTVGAACPASP